MGIVKKTVKFFDKLEDKVRTRLSKWPIVYTFIGGAAVVLFWRGIWMTADQFAFLTGPVSIILSSVILLITGVFVSAFITDRIILSGVKQEKKLVEKTEEEIKEEKDILGDLHVQLINLEKTVETIKEEIEEKIESPAASTVPADKSERTGSGKLV